MGSCCSHDDEIEEEEELECVEGPDSYVPFGQWPCRSCSNARPSVAWFAALFNLSLAKR